MVNRKQKFMIKGDFSMKKFLSSILAMLVISLSLPHVAFAYGTVDISDTTVTVRLNTTTNGLPASSDIGVNVYFTLNDHTGEGLAQANLGSISLKTFFNKEEVTIDEELPFTESDFTNEGNLNATFNNDDDKPYSKIEWTFDNCSSNIPIDIGSEHLLGTINFKAAKSFGQKDTFTMSFGDTEKEKATAVQFIDGSNAEIKATVDTGNLDTQSFKWLVNRTTIGDWTYYLYGDRTAAVIGFTGNDDVVSIPSQVAHDGTTYAVTSLYVSDFYGSETLTEVTIPKSVTFINPIQFSKTELLTTINVDKDNPNYKSIDGVLFSKDGTTLVTYPNAKAASYTIPDSVDTIDVAAFYCCDNLTDVTIPNSVTAIDQVAFGGCTALTNVTIPASVENINDRAFVSCTNLTTVNLYNPEVIFGEDPFVECPALTTVNVPHDYTGSLIINVSYHNGEDKENSTRQINPTLALHKWDAGVVTKEPTTSEEGVRTYTCTINGCEETKPESIPKLESEPSESTPTTETPSTEHVHTYKERVQAPTKDALGGTEHNCTGEDCSAFYWDTFTRDEAYAQTIMPNAETIYHYCTHNGLAAQTTVNIGNGQTLNVFLQDPLSTLITKPNQELGIYVNQIREGSPRYDELMGNYDDKSEIEHIIFFDVYPTVDGKPVTGQLDKSVYMEYQMPEGWDANDFQIKYVSSAADEDQPVQTLTIDGKTYFATWKKHFSPYAIIDKLTNEEKAAIQKQTGINIDSLSDEEKAQLDAALVEANKQAQETQTSNNSSNSVKTGDESGFIVMAAITAAVIAGLYIEICMKKKQVNR